jgi:hypothetical protein
VSVAYERSLAAEGLQARIQPPIVAAAQTREARVAAVSGFSFHFRAVGS